MRGLSKAYRVFIFIFKVGLGIFDEISDIIYYYNQNFQFPIIKSSMLLFLVLSPAIQTVAWSILLAQMKLDQPRPVKSDRVKQSKSLIQYVYNLCISCFLYYFKMIVEVIKFIPQSFGITILQEIKIFPFCLFGYTYFKYQAILTRDLMKNLAPHLVLFEKIEEEEEKENQISVENSQAVQQNQENQQQNPLQNSPKISINSRSFKASPESSSSPRKIINLKQTLQQSQLSIDKSNGSINKIQNIDNTFNLELKKGSSHIELEEIKNLQNLQNPLLKKQSINEQLYQKYFVNPQIQKNKGNQYSPQKSPQSGIINEAFEVMPTTFGNSILMMQQHKRRESILSPTKRRTIHQYADNINNNNNINKGSDEYNGDYPIQNRNRAISIKKKIGFDKSIQNLTNLLKLNNQQDLNRKRGISITKRETQPNINIQMANQFNQPHEPIHHNNHIELNNIKEEGDDGDDDNIKIFNETDLLLDANIIPTLETLIQDYNLEQFLLITDVIEAIFEALPMTVIQYINNGINDSWVNSDGSYNIFLYFTFITSLVTIIVHGISLINILYDENIKIFYYTLQFLQKFKMNDNSNETESQDEESIDKTPHLPDQKLDTKGNLETNKKSNSKKKREGFGRIFPMSSEVKIINSLQLRKLTILRQQACEEIKSLFLFFNDYRYQSQVIVGQIKKSLTKIKQLQKIVIELNRNYYNQDICPLITQIMHEQNNLNNFQMSYYDNPISPETAQSIYKIINTWHLKKEGNVEELLFQNDAIFVWRCQKFKTLYNTEESDIFEERLDNLFTSALQDKKIVEIILPDKEFKEIECQEIVECLNEWVNLKHFQMVCQSLPKEYEDQISRTLSSLTNIQSCLVVSESTGIIYKKGYNTSYNYQLNSYEIENQRFLFNYDILRILFTQELKLFQQLQTEKLTLNFEKKYDNQKSFREYQVKNLTKFVQYLKGLISLTLNLKNNNLISLAGEFIGECIENLKSLTDINLDLSDNRLGSVGVQNIMKYLVKTGRKFQTIAINLNRNLIQNEGAAHLINFLQDQSQKSTILELGKFTANRLEQSFFEQKKQIHLENLVLDLSNNRLQRDLLDQLFKVISTFTNLKSIQLKLTGNIIEVSQQFNFSQLTELNVLSLTFWCNNFSDFSLSNIFKSMKSIKRLNELTFELINNNMHDRIPSFVGHLDHLHMLSKLQLVYSKNGNSLSQLKDFDLTLVELRHLEELTLELSSCNFSRNGVTEISKSLQFLVSLLKVDLNFSENKDFTDECSSIIIDNINTLPQLSILILNYQKTAITDITIELIFKKIVAMATLRSVTFDFQENKTTESAMKYIVDGLIKSPHIQHPQFRI